MVQTAPEVNPCSTCRYAYGFLCVHHSVGHSVHGGLNQVQSSYALQENHKILAKHDSKMCGDSRRYYERKVERVMGVKPLVKSSFITQLINDGMKG